MVIAALEDSGRYAALHPRLAALFGYVAANDFGSASPGRIEVAGDDIYINVVEADMKAPGEQKLEAHREYIDVHIPLSAVETIGWRHAGSLGNSDAPFDEEGDFALYSEPAAGYYAVPPGSFCIVFPEDAHAPLIGTGPIRKLIAKVRV